MFPHRGVRVVGVQHRRRDRGSRRGNDGDHRRDWSWSLTVPASQERQAAHVSRNGPLWRWPRMRWRPQIFQHKT